MFPSNTTGWSTHLKRSSPRKQIILIIGPKPPPYHGVSVAIEKLLNSYLNKRFDVYHVDLADRRGIQHVGNPDIYNVILFFRQFFNAAKIICFKRPLIAYLPISQKTLGILRDSFFILLCLTGGCRVVLHLHGGNFKNWYEQRIRIFRIVIRMIIRPIAKMIVLSESFKNMFDGLIPPQKIAVVPNGVGSPPVLKELADRSLKRSSTALTVLYLGTLLRNKGVLVLLNSIPMVINERLDTRFIFAGPWFDERDRKEAVDIIKSRGIENAVHFTGAVAGRRKWEILKTSDIFVFPGIQQEGQPLVVLEAMAAGLPVIYTDRGCLSDVISDADNGFQVRINDPEDLAHKILLLARDPCMMREMGQRSRRRYESKYTDEHYISNMMNVFTTLSEGSASSNEV